MFSKPNILRRHKDWVMKLEDRGAWSKMQLDLLIRSRLALHKGGSSVRCWDDWISA
ncbi:hypothetical protein PISMIDRAFT_676925, partial [Pisolithus microcarpus 441]